MVHLVVAKYKEDTAWLHEIKHADGVFVYDKSGESNNNLPLPNVGREAHTYLHHIVSMYEQLADVTLFMQGNPFDHMCRVDTIQSYIDNPFPVFKPIQYKEHLFEDNARGVPHHHGLQIGDLHTKLMTDTPQLDKYRFSPGAQFSVPKESIKRYPIQFWKSALELSITREKFAWEMERIWLCLFI